MAIYQQSPGVQIIEKDASAVTVGLSTTIGAYVGAYRWGPVDSPMLISNEGQLATTFGQPNNDTYSHFFAAANFLAYTNAMYVNRAEVAGMNNANAANSTSLLIKNYTDYENGVSGGVGEFAARYPGELGSGLKVSIADSATYSAWEYKNQFTSAPGTSSYVASKGGANDEMHIVVVDTLGKFTGTPGTLLEKFGFVSKASDAISWEGLNNYYVNVLANRSEYVYSIAAPETDPYDTNADWGDSAATTPFKSLKFASAVEITAATLTGVVGVFTHDAGADAFVVNDVVYYTGGGGFASELVVTAVTATTFTATVPVGVVLNAAANTLSLLTSTGNPSAVNATQIINGTEQYDFNYLLTDGSDGADPIDDGELAIGWDVFLDSHTYDCSLLVTGNASVGLSRIIVQNIADVRKDCVAFTSITTTASGAATPIFASSSTKIADAIAFKTFDSSYAVIDSGYKYMYDKYNDKYRWIALNADIAGLCARVDATNDTWFSPAGMTKGQIKNVTKLSWNPSKAERDQLYPAAINPVINQVGQGTILFGDRTATTKPSAFDRINVRRLFLTLERSISNSAKYQLFELNDEITRLQFVASIEPFLRDVKGRRGIKEYRVICDETNNTPQVIATNSFVGTILIVPNYSINFITLNFVAVGPNVDFNVAASI